ncbi:MAG: polysaccharide biosynthesis tyrosine autokinase [Myxococcales bacterium]|nr:polysaccharide biosynthesis tyrosine autokinase [Myxococcota bacterium]MDW8281231.1 polysaccharide biosynthesis tyrosine autokinase [Myxococcales bacterium]
MADPPLVPNAGLPGSVGHHVPPAHAAQSAVHETTFDPNYVLHVLLKRLWLVVAIVGLVPTVVWLYVRRLPKEYQATASMVLDSATPQYLGPQFRDIVDFEHGSWWSAYEYMETQFRIIRSRRVASQVAVELCRHTLLDRSSGARVPAIQLVKPGVDCENPLSVEGAHGALQAMITVQSASRHSRVVELTAVGRNPELVALVANTYANTYIATNKDQRISESGRAAGWLGSEFSQLQKQLEDAEAALVEFRSEHNLLNLDEQQTDLMRKQRRISDELETVRLKLIALRPLRDRLVRAGEISDEGDPLAHLPPVLQESAIISKLKADYIKALQDRAELSSKYLEKHPKLVVQENLVTTLQKELRREIRLAIQGGLTQYDMLVQQEQELRRLAAEATKEVLALQAKIIEYNKLKLNFDRLKKIAETVGGRETESRLASKLPTNNVRLLDAALVPSAPIGPNTKQAVLTALGVAIVLAIGLAFLLELSDTTVKTQDDLEQVLGIPFLGMIPHLPEGAIEPGEEPARKDLFIARHPKSTVAECCRVIRTNLLFMSPDKPARTLLVTSAGPQEGKSMSSVSLALTMAQSGTRVLLVDTDMRRPRLHKVFGLSSGGIGLTTAIAGEVSALDAVQPTGEANLYFLPCGPMPPNPAELLQTERFRQIVQELSRSFDKVIFDSPPIGAVTDALVLSQVADGVILVAKSHKTSRDMLRRALRQLQDLSAHMLGVVLNDLDLDSRRKGYGYPYYYYYKSGYYKYGSYGSDQEESTKHRRAS